MNIIYSIHTHKHLTETQTLIYRHYFNSKSNINNNNKKKRVYSNNEREIYKFIIIIKKIYGKIFSNACLTFYVYALVYFYGF